MSMTTSYFKQLLFLAIFVFFCNKGNAQEDFTVLLEPEFSLNIDSPNRWSYNFGLSNRDLIYANEESIFEVRHVEITHFSSYEIGFYSKISLGFRYRFREAFNENLEDEKRFIQQYGHSRKYNALKIAHRVRLEERFREYTTFRARYEFSVEMPLSGLRIDQKEFFLVADSEALWSMGKFEKPSFEHRIGLSIGNDISKKTKATLGLEFRYTDYTNQPESELFIQTGISVNL